MGVITDDVEWYFTKEQPRTGSIVLEYGGPLAYADGWIAALLQENPDTILMLDATVTFHITGIACLQDDGLTGNSWMTVDACINRHELQDYKDEAIVPCATFAKYLMGAGLRSKLSGYTRVRVWDMRPEVQEK